MPFDIQPAAAPAGGRNYDLGLGGDWGWLGQQEFHYDRAWASIGNATRGKLGGGPTIMQAWSSIDPQKYAILAHPPPITSPILSGTRLGPHTRLGTVDLNMIDPFGTLAQVTGDAVGGDKPLVGTEGQFDPGAFLASKQIDIFGAGSTGVPARLADYALTIPSLLLAKARGVATAEPTANPAGLQYRFQADPGYWALLNAAGSDDTKLHNLATSVAGRYADPNTNGYLVDQLLQQFKGDRDQLTQLSSGNPRIDYSAKWRFTADFIAERTANATPFSAEDWASTTAGAAAFTGDVVSAIPFVGPQIAAGIAPVNPLIEKEWQKLTIDQRRQYLGDAGFRSVALDMAVALPLLTGMGAELAIAKGSAGIKGLLYTGYDTTLRATNLIMAAGVTQAVANWALEAAWPDYAAGLGKEIDRARPVSGSILAGVVNQVGFFSSGSFGVVPAVQLTGRVTSKVFSGIGRGLEAAHLPHATIGTLELPFFREVYGGSMHRNELTAAGVSGVETSVRASFMSHILNWAESVRRQTWEAALTGQETTLADINALDIPGRQAAAQEALARGMYDGTTIAENVIKNMALHNRPKPMGLRAGEDAAAWEVAGKQSKVLNEAVVSAGLDKYGPEWISSTIGGPHNAKTMEIWARAKVDQLGGDGAKLGKHDMEGWSKMVRLLHQVEYHRNNGELAAAMEMEASQEAGRLAMIDARHLFGDQADAAIAAIDGGDRSVIPGLIRDTREGGEWYANWKPKPGGVKTPEAVPPATFKAFLEDARPGLPNRRMNAQPGSETAAMPINDLQRRLDEQGTWTLAFKPVDAEGNLVSYTQLRGGGVLRSPWVEYPLGNLDNIALGNRGWMTSKMDSIFHGFRTRRLMEFQKGLLYRSVSESVTNAPGVAGVTNVMPAQIEAFHEKIMSIARTAHIQPQTIAAIARTHDFPFSQQIHEQVQKAAKDIFGSVKDANGRELDWGKILAKSYRQSFKLNLTAGLTSYLKSIGAPGSYAAIAADIIYPAWRFAFSPLFKGGEVLESAMYNAMRGVFRQDPVEAALYFRGGVGNDASTFNSEMAFDQMLQSLGGGEVGVAQRMGAALSFYARRAPEDFAMQREVASTQAAAMEAIQPRLDWEQAVNRLRAGEANVVNPITGEHLAAADIPFAEEQLRLAAQAQIVLPPLATDETGLLTQLRATFADKPIEQLPYTRPTYTEEGGLHAELNRIVGENGVTPGLEVRANEILDRLDAIERAKGDGGPVFSFWDLSPSQRQAVAKRIADEGYVFHGSSESPNVPNPRINNEAGFFTTTSMEDASWYASRAGTAEDIRGRPPGTVYVAQLPRSVLDLTNPTATAPIVAAIEADARAAIEATANGMVGPGARETSAYAREAQAFIDRYGPVNTAEAVQIRTRFGRFDAGIYSLAMKRAEYLRATGAKAPGKLFDTSYVNELMNKLGYDAYKTMEPPMLPRLPDTPAIADLRTRLANATRNYDNLTRGEAHWPGMTPDIHVARGEVQQLKLELNNAISAHAKPDIPVWVFRNKPTTVPIDEVYAQSQRRPGNATDLGSIPGTAEAVFDTTIQGLAEKAAAGDPRWAPYKKALDTFWHPTRYKQAKALALQIDFLKREFPEILRLSGNDGLTTMFKQLGIREDRWATWLLEDRKLLDDWLNSHGDQGALDALISHAGGDANRAAFNDLYSSEDWSTLTALWSLNLKSAADESFGVHFFSPYRSAAERSINHPVLGIYPASWTIKAAREWGKFLFQNQTFGELRLGMAPAQAIAAVAHAQASQFAMTNDDTLAHFLQKGPLGSTFFMFNLLMPGDWSSLPFSASRTIREVLRGNLDAGQILNANWNYMGLSRDARLMSESMGEIGTLIFGPKKVDQAAAANKALTKGLSQYSARGVESGWQSDGLR